jgi:hypothetical protein
MPAAIHKFQLAERKKTLKKVHVKMLMKPTPGINKLFLVG